MDPSSKYAMQALIGMRDKYDISVACDTDHDRHGIVTRSGGLLPPNHYLAVCIEFLFTHRPQWGEAMSVGKTVVSSSMIDRVARKLGAKLFEVPVGFKYFVEGLLHGSLGFAGEESAGSSFLRHNGSVWTTDKDGISPRSWRLRSPPSEGRTRHCLSRGELTMAIATLTQDLLLHETSEALSQEESVQTPKVLDPELLRKMNAYWRAANYVSVGQIYLYDNPLLKEPLKLSHVKPLVVSHWGTTPGQNFIYVHLNRAINKYDLNMFYIAGPGHGGPAIVGNVYLEGTWSEVYPNVTQDEAGLKLLFKQFSFPGGYLQPCCPDDAWVDSRGWRAGLFAQHAFGAAFDNPDLIVACVIGDGEAETGSLATAWRSNKFLDPRTDGAVLPILHLNGHKISNPTVLARIEYEEAEQFLTGCGWTPYFVEGDDPEAMHELMAATIDIAIADIKRFQEAARSNNVTTRPRWPMIVLKSPKGWTGPKVVDGLQIEGTFRAHQVPLLVDPQHPDHVELLEDWMKSYKAEELFDDKGRLIQELAELAPKGTRRMGSNPHANGGILLHDLQMPNFHEHAVTVTATGAIQIEDTLVLGSFLRDVAKLNQDKRNFRVFGPDETVSNLLQAVSKSRIDSGMRVNTATTNS